MKVIIAGSRTITNYQDIEDAVRLSGFDVTTVVSGTAEGADRLGEEWARRHKVPVERYPADWNTHGKKAGYIRNEQMAEVADALVAVWDGVSNGTRNMIQSMNRRAKHAFVSIPDTHVTNAVAEATQSTFGLLP